MTDSYIKFVWNSYPQTLEVRFSLQLRFRNFKVHYKRHLMKHYVQCLDDTEKLERINLKQAIYFTHDAWEDVKATSITNCYKRTGILPTCDTDAETDVTEQVAPTSVLQELRILLNDISVHVDVAINVEEYLAIESGVPTEATCMLTDQDIKALVRPDSTFDSSDDEPESKPVPKVRVKRARCGLEEGLLYMEQVLILHYNQNHKIPYLGVFARDYIYS